MDDAGLAVKHEERAEARERSRRMLAKPAKPSATNCVECDEVISQARRDAVADVELCAECKAFEERRAKR